MIAEEFAYMYPRTTTRLTQAVGKIHAVLDAIGEPTRMPGMPAVSRADASPPKELAGTAQ